MSFRNFVSGGVLAAALAFPLAASADSADCELHAFKATQVAPLRVRERAGRGTVDRLVGAQVFVPAQQGLSAEWLRSRVESHVLKMKDQPMESCPLTVSDIKVNVVSAGTGFWVQIAAKDAGKAKEVLHLAQAALQ
jgi:phosphoserine phosphatase